MNPLNQLKHIDLASYQALELAEVDYFQVEDLADLFYAYQFLRALEYAKDIFTKERLIEAITIANRRCEENEKSKFN